MPAILKKVKSRVKNKPGFRNKYSPIGLDLGSSMIKMIQFQNQGGKISVAKGFIGRTPEGTFQDGELIKPELLARKIKTVISENGWQGSTINLSLSPHAFSLCMVTMPPMDKRELKKAMYWEALQGFTRSEEDIVFDYCLQNSGSAKDSKARDYILAAASKDIAEKYTSILDLAGLKCSALEAEPLSLFRSFNSANYRQLTKDDSIPVNNFNQSRPAVLIYIGYCNSTILITGKGELFFYRSLKLGTYNFIRLLQDKYNCSQADAEKHLFIRAATTSNEELKPTTMQLALKIEQALNTWLDQSGQAEPVLQQLYFCGGGAFIPGLKSAIEKHLQIKGFIYNPLINLSQSGGKDSNGQNREDLFFPVAHGLALRGWIN